MDSNSTPSLEKNYRSVQQAVDRYCHQFGRHRDDVQLIAVSKKKPATQIEALYHLGHRAFGESYVQEAVEKIEALAALPIEWHFIGPIQSNKTRLIAEHFDWVHSVASLKVAQRLSDQRGEDQPPLNVLIQVNISNEISKSGIPMDEAIELANKVSGLPRIKLRGLMAIPAVSRSLPEQQDAFLRLAELLVQLNQQGMEMDCLSMGMSGDLEAAIAAGSTHVRIGTAIFGARQ